MERLRRRLRRSETRWVVYAATNACIPQKTRAAVWWPHSESSFIMANSLTLRPPILPPYYLITYSSHRQPRHRKWIRLFVKWRRPWQTFANTSRDFECRGLVRKGVNGHVANWRHRILETKILIHIIYVFLIWHEHNVADKSSPFVVRTMHYDNATRTSSENNGLHGNAICIYLFEHMLTPLLYTSNIYMFCIFVITSRL